MKFDNLPWKNSKKWEPGCWYPMMRTATWLNTEIDLPDGFQIFKLDPTIPESSKLYGDIVPVDGEVNSLAQAVKLCNAHNGFDLLKDFR